MTQPRVLFLFSLALLLVSSPPSVAAAAAAARRALFYGFDYGTSGVRCCMIDASTAAIVHEDALKWADVLPAVPSATATDRWEDAMQRLLKNTPEGLRPNVERICVSGTSSTVLLYDTDARAVSRQPRMYDFNVVQQCTDPAWGPRALAAIRNVCPSGSAANAATSTLAKALTWHYEAPVRAGERLVHQADYLVHYLATAGDGTSTGTRAFTSDWHNALKLGYDVHRLEYPAWLLSLLQEELGVSPQAVAAWLPAVSEPGRPVAAVGAWVRDALGFTHPDCQVVAGTTDSIAAFLASGADHPGQAVTSLGSTVAVKLLSERPVEDSARGVYSHRLGDRWLVGGASNVGCAILRQARGLYMCGWLHLSVVAHAVFFSLVCVCAGKVFGAGAGRVERGDRPVGGLPPPILPAARRQGGRALPRE